MEVGWLVGLFAGLFVGFVGFCLVGFYFTLKS